MGNPAQPPLGHMVLFDDIEPPLEDNLYRITVETDVTIDGAPAPVDPNANPLTKQSFFSIEGPRFQLAQTEVVGVFPPRNGHGSFSENVPHLVLSRRTLPWERLLDPANKFPVVVPQPGDAPPPAAKPPWLALLVFEDGDNFKIVQNMPLQQIVGPQIFQDLGNPPNVNCDALVTDVLTLQSVLPNVEELTLLTHVRQVNVDDRELNIGSTDGFFAVVMSNRLPSPNSNCTACLVSLEARSDLYLNFPPTAAAKAVEVLPKVQEAVSFPSPVKFPSPVLIGGVGQIGYINPIVYQIQSVQLVLLHSWKFSATGSGSFRDLMQELDVAMFGTVANPGHPPLTDSGHIPMELQDRAGEPEKVYFRGPLAPFQLTRDLLGPYHSADQCVRATPETGGKDISYAAAFEVGRLLAASDKSLAAALMQWRRTAYSQASRADTLGRAQTALGIASIDIHNPTQPFLASGAAALAAQGAGPISDPFGLDKVQTVVGFNPTALQQAFNLANPQEAIAILGGNAGATGATVSRIVQTTRNATTIDEVAADAAGLGRLSQVRNQTLVNTTVQLGPPAVSQISPTQGPIAGGTIVTITGSHFTGTMGVNFGPAAATGVSIVSDSEITAVSPPGQGTVDVTVTSPSGTSATGPADRFTYLPPPTVTTVKPNIGPAHGGTKVDIAGSGFTGTTAVQFGTVAATFVVTNDSATQAVSPPGSGTVDVTVITPGGTSATTPAAIVSSGSGVLQGTWLFDFDLGREVGAGVVSDVWWDQQTAVLRQMVPQGSAKIVNLGVVDFDSLSVAELQNLVYGTAPIRGNNDASNQLVQGDVFAVLTHGGNYAKVQVSNYDYNLTIRWVTTSAASPADQFTYLPSATVASIKPNQGSAAGGTQVAVAGSGFTGATAVQFGSLAAASFVVASDTAIQAVSPAGQGTVDITVTSPGGTSAVSPADKFTYIPPPVVTGVNPNFLNPGQSTTVSGSGFSGASAVNFGTVPAASFAVVSDTQINAVIPQGSGSVNVTVTTSAGTSAISTADVFTYVILE